MKPAQIEIECRGKTLNLSIPRVMGILNATPDSFSDGGKFTGTDRALKRIEEMVEQGADIIDVGGESTRPGSDPVSEDEEIRRTIPLLEAAIPEFPQTLFSIDTTKFEVAKKALDTGAHIINDVSGLDREPRFVDLCAKSGAAYICMHSQGNPKTMQKNPDYENVIEDIYELFTRKLDVLKKGGVSTVIIDPGIGFGKSLQHNLELIAGLDRFLELNCPVMVGASRKSMIGAILNERPVDDRLIGTISVHYHCLIKGAKILRVHDVKEASDSIRIFQAINNTNRIIK